MKKHHHTTSLLAAERRARTLILHDRPGPNAEWRLEAVPGPYGATLLAAARWASRLGANVSVVAGEDGGPFWDALVDSVRRQNLLDASRGATRNLLNASAPELPDPDAAWAACLGGSSPLILSVSPDMPALSCARSREIDRAAIDDFAVPGVCLMENAAVAAVVAARDMLAGSSTSTPSVAVVCGGGNNGGDGFAMARGLDVMGVATEALLLKSPASLKGDALVNYELLATRPGVRIHLMADDQSALPSVLEGKSLIVDALLGTGFAGDLAPSFFRAIEAMNASHIPVLAVDIPSGLNGDSGQPAGTAVRAARTITFAAIKSGLIQAGAAPYVGELFLGDIGAPSACYPF